MDADEQEPSLVLKTVGSIVVIVRYINFKAVEVISKPDFPLM
jgi:hypothetical protein